MKLCTAGLTLALLTSSYCSALPPNKEHKERVVDTKLSEKEHDLDGDHNSDYDHDAFMGKEADEFDNLSPEESKHRLGLIVDKIDKDHDGLVSEEELQQWIQYVQKKYVLEDTERMWKDHELESGELTWESYRQRTYGYEHDPEEEDDYVDMVKKDERKFKQADHDHDGKLTKDEFAAFLHPEEYDHMKDIVVLGDSWICITKSSLQHIGHRGDSEMGDTSEDFLEMVRKDERKFHAADINSNRKLSLEEFEAFRHPECFEHMSEVVVLETMEDIDKDKDGKISIEEYIADIYNPDEDDEDDEDSDYPQDNEDGNRNGFPDWVDSEMDQFKDFRDRDHDGHLDLEEVRQWVIPEEYDNSEVETKHLFGQCDVDGVGDMWPHKEEEPEWVVGERDQFKTYRDTDGDGVMTHEEVKNWIIPPNYDHSEAEAKHLIYESDDNKDGKLTKQEILDHHEIFVGSQATDFGDALNRHDEF